MAVNSLVGELERIAHGYVLVEGPVPGDEDGVYFADVRQGGIYHVLPGQPARCVIEHRRGIGGMVSNSDGGFVVSGRNLAVKWFDQGTTIIADRDEEAGRFLYNDLTTDPEGRIYVGTFATNEPFEVDAQGRTGALHMIDLDGSITVVDDDYIAPNGMAFSPDGSLLYVNETGRRTLWRYEVRKPGELTAKTAFHEFGQDSSPDGMATAADGTIWIAMANPSGVMVLSPGGDLLEMIPVPSPMVASLCFGGRDNRTIFVCTGSHGPSGEDGHGGVFYGRASVAGNPVSPARIVTGSAGAPRDK